MRIDYLTLFPEVFDGVLDHLILKHAQDGNIIKINIINPRDYAENKHNQVDDYPYGGSQGAALEPEPIFNAMQDLKRTDKTRVILMRPQRRPLSQAAVEELSKAEHTVLICEHYEGYDERIRENLVTNEISMGDYILAGGELPVVTMTDVIIRLIPGVLGNEQSYQDDLFSDGSLEFPRYTRSRGYKDITVPDVLLSGNYANIEKWRHEQGLVCTLRKRSDLLEKYQLSNRDKELLESYKNQLKNS